MKALEAQKYEEAAALFTKAVAADPKDYSAHFHLALSYSLLEKDTQAIAEYKPCSTFSRTLRSRSESRPAARSHARPCGRHPAFESRGREKPQQFRPVFYLGEALLETGAMADAEAAYRTAVALQADSVPAQVGLARAIARQGRLNDAEPCCSKPSRWILPEKTCCWSSPRSMKPFNPKKPSPSIAISRRIPARRNTWDY